MRLLRISVLILLTLCVYVQAEMPQNVIFMIGDGMGYAQIEATKDYFTDMETLSFESFENQAECTTYSANSSITDSAAAGTALATGFKVNNGVISMEFPGDGSELLTLLEYAKGEGKSVGLVTTTYLTHATPACFGAHEPSRNNLSQIALDYLTQTKPNVLFGGGGNGLNSDSFSSAGYDVYTDLDNITFNSIIPISSYVLAQFGDTHMPYKYDYIDTDPYPYPLLYEMVIKAVDILSQNPNGYFLMVEGGRIDHACHANELELCVWETRDFSFAVEAAVTIAGSDTLILVTADHETGGLYFNETSETWEFSTGDHTADNVPVYAIGPNADLVSQIMDNTDMFTVCCGETSEPPIEEIYYAIGEDTVRGIVQEGNYNDTHDSGGGCEVIQEVLNNPNKNGYSLLEHVWTFNIGSAASAVFYVEAFHSSNSEGDDFVFSYSTDGVYYTDMLTVYSTSDDDVLLYYDFPPSISGTVYVRVTDTDHTKGNKSLDTLSVDQMYIHAGGDVPESDPQYMYDSVVLDTVRADKGTISGMAIVTIVDDYGNPVNDILVDGHFTGAFEDSFSAVSTNGNGTVVFETSTSAKKPSFGFEVTNVTDVTGTLVWVE